VVPVDAPRTLEHIDAEEAQRRLLSAGIAPLSGVRKDAPTEPIAVLR
jgi:hypothetical protein